MSGPSPDLVRRIIEHAAADREAAERVADVRTGERVGENPDIQELAQSVDKWVTRKAKAIIALGLLAVTLIAQTPGKYGRWIVGVNSAAQEAERNYINGKSTDFEVILGIQDCQGNQIETSRHATMDDAKRKAKEHGIMGCSGTIAKKPNHESGKTGVGAWRVE